MSDDDVKDEASTTEQTGSSASAQGDGDPGDPPPVAEKAPPTADGD